MSIELLLIIKSSVINLCVGHRNTEKLPTSVPNIIMDMLMRYFTNKKQVKMYLVWNCQIKLKNKETNRMKVKKLWEQKKINKFRKKIHSILHNLNKTTLRITNKIKKIHLIKTKEMHYLSFGKIQKLLAIYVIRIGNRFSMMNLQARIKKLRFYL